MGKKAYLLLGLLLVLLAAAGVSLGRASTQGEYVAAAGAQSLYRLQVAKGRGTIYDRNGQPLVGTTRELLGAVAPTLESIGALETATHGAFRSRLALALEDGKPFVLTLPTLVEHPCVDLFTVPDAVASLSNYLARHGWKAGLSRERQHALLMRYNHSTVYANTIMALADRVAALK